METSSTSLLQKPENKPESKNKEMGVHKIKMLPRRKKTI